MNPRYMAWPEDIDLPAIFQTISSNPKALELVKQLNETICFGNSALTRMQEEAIATVVAVTNQCRYGALTHGGFFRRHSGDPKMASNLLDDYTRADLDPRNRLMLDFAVRLTREPGSFTAQDVDGLQRAGFDQEAIVSIVLITCLFNFMNRLATSFGVEVPPSYRKVVESWLSGPAALETWLLPPVEFQSDESHSDRLGLDVPRSQQNTAGQGRPQQDQQDKGQDPPHGQRSDAEESPNARDQLDTEQAPLHQDQQDAGPGPTGRYGRDARQNPSAGGGQGRGDFPSRSDQHETGKGPSIEDQRDTQPGPSRGDRQEIGEIGEIASQAEQESAAKLENQVTQEVMQSVERFISQCCTVASGESTTARDLYISYLRWCDDNREHALLQRNFGMQLTRLGYLRRRRSGGRHWWQGIGLEGQET